uniref:WEB family protein At3g02930, chloroplastic-like n=1 Tax=Tanacetum cinerariifolium TaxID=118510 RepID=A0A699H0A2_TANCI|nr:WEB family protein At3g02930, chloroplastic-like [Tanacetum cinerariifolium]
MTCDAKDQALHHADDATKIAENQAEKVETLSAEITRLKGLLNAKFESKADQSDKMVTGLNLEIETLKSEVEKSEKLVLERKSKIETLNSENAYDKNGTNPSKNEQNRAQNEKRKKVKVKPDKVEAEEIKMSRKIKKKGQNCYFPKFYKDGGVICHVAKIKFRGAKLATQKDLCCNILYNP